MELHRLNNSFDKFNIELDRVMGDMCGRMEYISKLSSESPLSEGDKKFIEDTRNQWLDMALCYPMIKMRNEKIFFSINQFFFNEQPPV